MRLLVFGQTGQVARGLARKAPQSVQLIALGRKEADLARPQDCAEAVRTTDCDAVVNAAAYTDVDGAEAEEALATMINGDAPSAMARAAAEKGVPFLHVSTDYVFDGSGSEPWQPDAPTAPLGAYGRSKLAGEKGVREAGGAYAILRTSWVFSSHGKNFVKTILRLSENRDMLDIVSDQTGGPTQAAEIASALLKMAEAYVRGSATPGIYHFAGEPDESWAGFARAILAASGRKTAVNDVPSESYPTPARRPANSRLDCSSLMREFGIARPDWKEGMAEALRELGGMKE